MKDWINIPRKQSRTGWQKHWFDTTNYSECASPTVPVVKGNGKIGLCGDYKATMNPSIKSDVHPLPTVNEALAELAGGKFFSKLDFDTAYISSETSFWYCFSAKQLQKINGISLVKFEGHSSERLRAVLQRLSWTPLNRQKYQLAMEVVSFLRFKINARGIHRTDAKATSKVRQSEAKPTGSSANGGKHQQAVRETENERKWMKDRKLSVGDTVLWT
ncbi:Uncharacterized protein T4E_2511 [Trichinella pseudospiralis]|uniref:Uncharacterized protein n=1 Tax=Trichinella pseudospiralis TaxID=6337 RepID=A0A0V0Y0W6_TRIPS|nr:Uncharacterized protein T4E_2511 [Trichinella pseudospiralis]